MNISDMISTVPNTSKPQIFISIFCEFHAFFLAKPISKAFVDMGKFQQEQHIGKFKKALILAI